VSLCGISQHYLRLRTSVPIFLCDRIAGMTPEGVSPPSGNLLGGFFSTDILVNVLDGIFFYFFV